MITKISKIKDFGIFSDFKWSGGLDDFKRYNVLYGWNYSGKTTLSRILRCFELGVMHTGYSRGSFVLKDEDNNTFDHTSLQNFPYELRVFNSDFVKDNLKWEESEGDIEPILMLGEKNIELEKKLNEKKDTLTKNNTEYLENCRKKTDKINTINRALTEKARNITNILSLGRTFTKTHFEQQIKSIGEPNKIILPDNDIATFLKKYNSTDKKLKLETLQLSVASLSDIATSVQSLLNKTVKAEVIQRLKDDSELNTWVKKGKDLHKGKDTCQFCGGKLPEDLIAKLNKHFSDEYESILSEIDNSKTMLEDKKITVDIKDKARFYHQYRNEYSELSKLFIAQSKKYNMIIDTMENKLQEKETNPFKKVLIGEINDNSSKIKDAIAEINGVIKRHNQRTEQFEDEKAEAKEKLLKHYTAEFIQSRNYYGVCKEVEELKTKIDKTYKNIQTIENEISQIESQLSDASKGAETINKYLKSYFGRDDIQIEAKGEKQFKLIRLGKPAENLSEGEKTAISFAYFVSKIHDKNTDLTKAIVFIDDPVCSLDNNHLFHTFSMIKNTFEDCKQLFISTHNFELFNLIKNWLKAKPSYYLVERKTENGNIFANILKLPEVLYKFKSEYHYLFFQIYNFHISPYSDHNALYNLPNLVRRLLEAFMGFKVPIHAGLNKKLPFLIEDDVKREKVWKFINQYSHNRSLPSSLQFPDLSECEEVVRIVLNSMNKKDAEHYKCLVDEINVDVKSEQERLRKVGPKIKEAQVVAKPEIKTEYSEIIFHDSIKIKTIGRAAAKNEFCVIESSENVIDSLLKPFAIAYVSGDTLEPVARYGQYVLLAQPDDMAVDGDLVAVESHDGARYLRRMNIIGDTLSVYSINPIRVISPVQIKYENCSVYKVIGVIYESTLFSKTDKTLHKGEWNPYENFDASFFDDLKMIIVEGDSLEPIAFKGQKVLVDVAKKPDKYSIENGGLAAIETHDDIGCVIKKVFKKEKEWTLVSPNPLAEYAPDIVSVEKIKKVWPLCGVIFEIAPE